MSAYISLPSAITVLIQRRTLDWGEINLLVEDQGDEFDWQSLEYRLLERMRASPHQVDDAIDLFCRLLGYSSCIDSLLHKLRKDVYMRFSSESIIELLQGINTCCRSTHMYGQGNGRMCFMWACRPLLNAAIEEDTIENFKAIVL